MSLIVVLLILGICTTCFALRENDDLKPLRDKFAKAKCVVIGTFYINQKLGPHQYLISDVQFQFMRVSAPAILKTKSMDWESEGEAYGPIAAKDSERRKVTMDDGFSKVIPVFVEDSVCRDLAKKLQGSK